MKQIQLYLFALCTLNLGLLTACSNDDNNGSSGESNNENEHSYYIEIADGETYQGSVPKATGGIYYPIAFVEYNEEIDSEVLAGMLYDTGNFQFGIGLALDDNNNVSIQGSGPGLVFGEWAAEELYVPAGNINISLENYEEHNISLYGETGIVASFTLTFSGTFKLGDDGEEVSVTGKLVVAAP